MKHSYIQLLLSVLAVMVSSGAAGPGKADDSTVPVFTSLDHGKQLSLSVDKVFKVALQASAGSGYKWQLQALEAKSLQLVDRHTYPQKTATAGFVGGSYRDVWVFKALKKGTTQLRFDLLRPWEGRGAAKDSVTLTIIVQP